MSTDGFLVTKVIERGIVAYLLGNIVFATAFMLIIKWVQVRNREDTLTIGALNYIIGAIATLPYMMAQESRPIDMPACGTGILMGTSYFIGYFLVNFVVRLSGAAAAAVIASMSLIVPIACGIAIWGEAPTEVQKIGIGASIVSLVLVGGARQGNANSKGGRRSSGNRRNEAGGVPVRRWLGLVMLTGFFLICGLSRLAQEAFKHVCEPGDRPLFMVSALFSAAIPSALLLLTRRRPIRAAEWRLGALMGLANVTQVQLMLLALDEMDGFIAFPAAGIGCLLLTTVVAVSLLGERLSRTTKIGIFIACAALVLLNWPA